MKSILIIDQETRYLQDAIQQVGDIKEALQLPPHEYSMVLFNQNQAEHTEDALERLEKHFDSVPIMWMSHPPSHVQARRSRLLTLFEQVLCSPSVAKLKYALANFIQQHIKSTHFFIYLTMLDDTTDQMRYQQDVEDIMEKWLLRNTSPANSPGPYHIIPRGPGHEIGQILEKLDGNYAVVLPIFRQIFTLGYIFVVLDDITPGMLNDLETASGLFTIALEEAYKAPKTPAHNDWQEALLQSDTDAIALIDNNQIVATTNDNFQAIFGLNLPAEVELTVQNFLEIVTEATLSPADTRAHINKALEDFYASLVPYISIHVEFSRLGTCELALSRKNGTTSANIPYIITLQQLHRQEAPLADGIIQELQTWLTRTEINLQHGAALGPAQTLQHMQDHIAQLSDVVHMYEELVQQPQHTREKTSIVGLLEHIFASYDNSLKWHLWDSPTFQGELFTNIDPKLTQAALVSLLEYVQGVTWVFKPRIDIIATTEIFDLRILLENPKLSVNPRILERLLEGAPPTNHYVHLVHIATAARQLTAQDITINKKVTDKEISITLTFPLVQAAKEITAPPKLAPPQQATPPPMRLLSVLISGDYTEAEALRPILRNWGYDLWVHRQADEAIASLHGRDVNAVFISTSYREDDPISLCEEITQHYDQPVVLIENSRVPLINSNWEQAGATDLLEDIHSERSQARLRRVLTLLREPYTYHPTIYVGSMAIEPGKREVYAQGKQIPLSDIQFDIIYRLAQNRTRVVMYEELFSMWENNDGNLNKVQIQMTRIRSKLEAFNVGFEITTARGRGYQLKITDG